MNSDQLLEKAKEYIEDNDYFMAQTTLNELIEQDEAYAEAYYLRAVCKYDAAIIIEDHKIDFESIKIDLANAISIDKNYKLARQFRCYILISVTKDNYEIALEDSEFLIKNIDETDNLDFYLMARALCLTNLKRFEESINQLENFLQNKKKNQEKRSENESIFRDVYWEIAKNFRLLENKNQAIKNYNLALSHHPDSSNLLIEIGFYTFEIGDYEAAANHFANVSTWQDWDDMEKVANFLEQKIYIENFVNKHIYFAYSMLLFDSDFLEEKYQEKRYVRTLDLAKKIVEIDPKYNRVNLIFARSHFNTNNLEKAIFFYEKYDFKAHNDIFSQARYLQTRIDANLPFPEKFEFVSSGETAYHYYNAGIWVNDKLKENSQVNAEDYRQFVEDSYITGIELFHNYFENNIGNSVNNQPHIFAMNCHNLANFYYFDDDKTDEIIYYEELGLKYSRFFENVSNLARYYTEKHQYDDAILLFESIFNDLNEDQTIEDGYTLARIQDYGFCLNQTNQHEKAKILLAKALQDLYLLSTEDLEEIEDDYAVFSNIVTEYAAAFEETNDWEKAKEIYETAIAQSPSNLSLINNFGYRCYHKRELFSEAIHIYSQGISVSHLDKRDNKTALPTLYLNRAKIYFYELKDYEKATHDFEKLYELQPNYFHASRVMASLNYSNKEIMANAWAKNAEQLLNQEQEEDDQEKAWFYSTWAGIAYVINDFPNCVSHYDKAYNLNTEYDTKESRENYDYAKSKSSGGWNFFRNIFS